MKNPITSLRIWSLKRRARRHYLAHHYRSGDGGRHITNIITGGVVDYHANEFNRTLDRLAELDPETPTARLEVEAAAGGAA